MLIVDYVVITFLLVFFWKGFRSGLVGMLGWLAGWLAGIWLAGRFYQTVAGWLAPYLSNQIVASIIAFIAVMIAVVIVVGIVFRIVNRVFNLIPVIGFLNKFIGGLLGVVEAMIILGIGFWLVTLIPFSNSFTRAVQDSQLRPPIVQATSIVRNLIPQSLKALADINRQLQDFDIDAAKDELQQDILENISPEQMELLRQKIMEEQNEAN